MTRYTHLIEADIEGYLIKQMSLRKAEIRKLAWIGRRNAPDRLCAGEDLPKETFPCFIELKKPGEAASDAQLREHERMRKGGLRVYVINSHAGINRLFRGEEP